MLLVLLREGGPKGGREGGKARRQKSDLAARPRTAPRRRPRREEEASGDERWPLSLLFLSPSPLRLISPRRGEKAKRPTLIPSSANDDTDTSAQGVEGGRMRRRKGEFLTLRPAPRQPIELGSSLYYCEKVCFQTFSRRTDNERVGSQDLGQRTPCLVK